MGNEIAKALKRKVDNQFRVTGEDYTPSIVEKADGVVVYNAPAENIMPYVAGKNVNIGQSGNNKVINAIMNIIPGANITVSSPDENGAVTVSASIGGKPINLAGLIDGYVLKYDSISDSFIVGDGGGGGLAEVPQATETTLGGIVAKEKTTETAEVAIDPITGKLYAPESGGGAGGFIDLSDTPNSYVGHSEKVPFVNSDGTGLEFKTPFRLFVAGGVLKETFDGSTPVFPETIVGFSKSAGGLTGSCMATPNNSTTSSYSIVVNIPTSGELSFYYKFASTFSTTYTEFRVYIDGSLQFTIPGNAASTWTKKTWPIAPGNHTIKFEKYNNYGASSRLLLDDISVPGNGFYDMDAVMQNPDKLLFTSSSGESVGFLPKSTFMESLSGAMLPTAAVGYRGKIFTVLGDVGVADASYICQKDATDTYVWTQI